MILRIDLMQVWGSIRHLNSMLRLMIVSGRRAKRNTTGANIMSCATWTTPNGYPWTTKTKNSRTWLNKRSKWKSVLICLLWRMIWSLRRRKSLKSIKSWRSLRPNLEKRKSCRSSKREVIRRSTSSKVGRRLMLARLTTIQPLRWGISASKT